MKIIPGAGFKNQHAHRIARATAFTFPASKISRYSEYSKEKTTTNLTNIRKNHK
jgi:hypothetical protein